MNLNILYEDNQNYELLLKTIFNDFIEVDGEYMIGYHSTPTFHAVDSIFSNGIKVESGAKAFYFYPKPLDDFGLYIIRLKAGPLKYFEFWKGFNNIKKIKSAIPPTHGAIMLKECVIFKEFVNKIKLIDFGLNINGKIKWVGHPKNFNYKKYANIISSKYKKDWQLDFENNVIPKERIHAATTRWGGYK